MSIKEACRILVLDPIHGAEVIAEELKELEKQVEVFDPYHQTFSKALDYDLVIAPVHLNPNFEVVRQTLKMEIPIVNHHEAVKEIAALKNLFAGIKVVEVTGTVGKTAVCELICQLLNKEKFEVLSHTSSSTRFKSVEKGVLFPRIGSTPANMLKVMEIAREKNLKPNIAVFEVSLGLTGAGNVGVITSLKADYRIAGGTKDASVVKRGSMKNYESKHGSIIVHPGSLRTDEEMVANTFGNKDNSLWISKRENKVIFNRLRTITGDSISGEIAFKSFDLFGGEYYRNSLEAAFCAVLSLGIPPEEVNTNISAVKGRMKLEKLKGRFLIDNSNSGTKLKFLDEITRMARQYSEKMILIVGEESQYVCEGVDLEEVKQVVKNVVSDFVEIIIVGEEFRDKIGGENVFFSDDLDSALEKAVNDSEEGFVIVSNVKTWR
ncbi:MAG: coenzyme F430 synthase [Methanophagales archaeon]|nr:coenzyme F430 synthase [Methanophagales archaeon]